jgi:N-dimethylarginine dimethylaminohydrolase
MTPSQNIQLQALKLKATIEGSHPSLIDAILENPANKEGLKKEFRNVCALINIPQFEALESLCSLLDLSKREVISMALNDFIPKANAIVAEVNPFEHADELSSLREGK